MLNQIIETVGTPHNSAPHTKAANIVAKLRNLLGHGAVLIPIESGTKAPRRKGWQETTRAVMDDPEYLRQLARGNIGVLQGAPSGRLCSIDIDSDEAAQAFLDLNPQLKQTLQSRGARGMNIWVRVTGDYPALTKLKFRNGEDFGEWRADGGQTVIHGRHPSGCDYQITNEARPVEIAFESLNWLNDVVLPWDTALYHELVKEHGEPFYKTKKALRLNHYFFP